MLETFERLDLADLTQAQLAPLERLMSAEWPDFWRDLATSCYVTLLSAPGAEAVAAEHLARLAAALTEGVASDLGGTQPYISVGHALMRSARMRRVLDLLAQGKSYKQAGDATGLTASRVRNIERAWHREQQALRQGRLALD